LFLEATNLLPLAPGILARAIAGLAPSSTNLSSLIISKEISLSASRMPSLTESS